MATTDKDNSFYSNIRLQHLLRKVDWEDPDNEFLQDICRRLGKSSPRDLVQELREDGSNTIGRLLTGAVNYDEVVRRVAEKVGVKKSSLTDDEAKNELLIIRKMVQAYLQKHPEAESRLKELAREKGAKYDAFMYLFLSGSSNAFLAMAASIAPKIVSGVVFSTLVTFAGVQTAATAARVALAVVPFINVFMGFWLVMNLSGPAYRKIVPTVIDIALLRLQFGGEGEKGGTARPAKDERTPAEDAPSSGIPGFFEKDGPDSSGFVASGSVVPGFVASGSVVPVSVASGDGKAEETPE